MNNRQVYSNGSNIRGAELREIKTKASAILYIPIYKGKFFWNSKQVLFNSLPTELVDLTTRIYFLGLIEGKEIWCIDFSEIAYELLTEYFKSSELSCVRSFYHQLPPTEASLLGYAKGLANWHNTHQFCGSCGSKTSIQEKGHKRTCENKVCGVFHFPRIDPAVIVLIEYKPKGKAPLCLLNIKKKEYGAMCSLFSGFSEIGESLEDTVVREMKEEVNVSVFNLKYMASQPWSFPASLMVGFKAEVDNISFTIDNKEIKEAKWFSVDEIKQLVKENKLVISKEDSISNYMIRKWLKENSY